MMSIAPTMRHINTLTGSQSRNLGKYAGNISFCMGGEVRLTRSMQGYGMEARPVIERSQRSNIGEKSCAVCRLQTVDNYN